MEETYVRPRSGVPLGHKVFALLLAAAAGWLLWTWLGKRATESASAVLAFDPAPAQKVDPGLTSAAKPAMALADSILNDQAIAGLAQQAHLSSSTAASRIGEFRSSLELTEPSSAVLRVRYLDRDSSRSAANANAVARVLAAWMPSGAGAGAAAAAPAPAAAPPQPATPHSASAPGPPPEDQGHENRPVVASSSPRHELSDALGELGAQLSATDRELDGLAAERGAAEAAYRQSREQKLLTARVNAAGRTLADLRAQYGDEAPGVKGRLTEMQEALRSILPGRDRSRYSRYAFRAVGTSASELRRERSELRDAIAVVNRDRQAIKRIEASSAAAGTSPAASAPPASPVSAAASSPASAPAATAQTPSSIQEQTLPASGSGNPVAQQGSGHPLSIVRLATPTSPPPLWQAIVAGLVCGLLYLGIAALAYRRGGSDEAYAEESAYPQRFITPAGPVNPPRETVRPSGETASPPRETIELPGLAEEQPSEPEEPVMAVGKTAEPPVAPPVAPDPPVVAPGKPAARPAWDWSARRTEPAEADRPPRQRASFSFDAPPARKGDSWLAALLTNADKEAPAQPSSGTPEEPVREAAPPAPSEVGGETAETPAGQVDPVTDQIRKSLSQTSIGRMFEGSNGDAADNPEENGQEHGQEHSGNPDRMVS